MPNLLAHSSSPFAYGLVLLLLSIIPLVLLSLTSFIKFSVVFSILRSALGAGQLPSAAITSLVALILTAYVMLPVFSEISLNLQNQKNIKTDLNSIFSILNESSLPLQTFLEKHAGQKERDFFKGLLPENQSKNLKMENLVTIASAFVVSELKESFAVGFAIYIPFLIIDLVVANILVGMGMMMVSPITISVPAKIALFVLCDGWYLLCKGLVMSYVEV